MIEAAVVIYIRQILYAGGFQLLHIPMNDMVLRVELIREVASLILLWAAAELSAKTPQTKFYVFIALFGLWDIFYYVFLKILINWPADLLVWDILFLIPWIWTGPVLAPILVSLGMIAAGITGLYLSEKQIYLTLGAKFWAAEIAACILILTSFLLPGKELMANVMPSAFPWFLFGVGLTGGFGFFLWILKSGKTTSHL